MTMFTPPPFITGGPKEIRSQLVNVPFFNTEQERRTVAAAEVHIRENFTNRIVDESTQALRNIDDGAREQSQMIAGLDARADEALSQTNSLDVSLREARKSRSDVARALAEAKMEYEAAVEDYERQLYNRDHPEDVINDLLRKYPVLRENLPLFYL